MDEDDGKSRRAEHNRNEQAQQHWHLEFEWELYSCPFSPLLMQRKVAAGVAYASARSFARNSRTTPIDLSVLAMDFKPSVSMPVNARMASIVSGTTIAWLLT